LLEPETPDTNYTHRQFHNLACYALSKICLAAQYLVGDISLRNNDISIIRSDISLRNNDISMIRSDISLSCSDISLSENDISLSGSDISLGKNDISLSCIDISLGKNDISLGANDKSRRTQRNIATATTIALRYLRDISFQEKYRSNIADISRLSRYSSIIVCITFAQYCI
jgi:hypothetical protein